MKNVSNAFKNAMKDNTQFRRRITLRLTNGDTLNLDESNLWSNGFELEQASSSNNSFDIGSVIVGKLSLSINNIDNEFSGYVFDGASVTAYIGLETETSSVEWIQMFSGNVVESPYQNASIIKLVCYDNLYKLDKEYVPYRAGMQASAEELVRYIVKECLGSYAMLATPNFENSTVKFTDYDPKDSSTTYRQMLAWIAQALGLFAICQPDGKITLKWYSNIDGYATVNKKTNLTTFLDDVVITGIEVTSESENMSDKKQYLFGDKGYVISVSNNKLITNDNFDSIGRLLNSKISGMRFRPFSAAIFTDPTLEIGDYVTFSDRDGNTYYSYITNMKLKPSAFSSVSCGATPPERNSAKQYSLVNQIQGDTSRAIRTVETESENMAKLISQGLGVNYGDYTLPNGAVVKATYDGDSPDTSLWISYTTSEGTLQQMRNSVDEPWGVASAVDRYGNGLYQVLTARGLNADWINAGHLTADLLDGKIEDKTGNTRVSFWNLKTGEVYIDANKFTLFSSGSSSEQITIGDYVDAVAEEAAKKALEASEVANIIIGFQQQLDSKVESYYQESMPGFDEYGNLIWTGIAESDIQDNDGNYIFASYAEGKPAEETEEFRIRTKYEYDVSRHEGDLWRQPSTGKDFVFYAGKWIEKENPVPDAVYDAIGGKAQIFTEQPTVPYNLGDLWFINDKSDILTCVRARPAQDGFDPRDWEKRNKYTDDTVANKAEQNAQTAIQKADQAQSDVDKLDSEEIFNRVTEYGKTQGIFLEDKRLYINGEYIKAGTIKADQIAAGKMTLNDGMELVGSTGKISLFSGWDGANTTSGIQMYATTIANGNATNLVAVSNKGVGIFTQDSLSVGHGIYITSASEYEVRLTGANLVIPRNQAIWWADTDYKVSIGVNTTDNELQIGGYGAHIYGHGKPITLDGSYTNVNGGLQVHGNVSVVDNGVFKANGKNGVSGDFTFIQGIDSNWNLYYLTLTFDKGILTGWS